MTDALTGNHFAGIGGVSPSYPVRPVDPSNKDRPSSGERRRKPAKPPGSNEEADNGNPGERPPAGHSEGKIDEYI